MSFINLPAVTFLVFSGLYIFHKERNSEVSGQRPGRTCVFVSLFCCAVQLRCPAAALVNAEIAFKSCQDCSELTNETCG